MDFNDKKYTRWLAAAQETLAAAKNDEKGKFYNWACFKVQQAIEFGLKSLLYGIGLVPFGHSVTELTGTLVDNIGDPVLKKECREKLDAECLKYLDKLYIPTRYADAFASGSPSDYYTEKDGAKAITCGEQLLNAVTIIRNQLLQKQLKQGGQIP